MYVIAKKRTNADERQLRNQTKMLIDGCANRMELQDKLQDSVVGCANRMELQDKLQDSVVCLYGDDVHADLKNEQDQACKEAEIKACGYKRSLIEEILVHKVC